MEIKRYKYLGSNKYKLTLDDKDIILYEDIIVNHNLLAKKELSFNELSLLVTENNYYHYYYKALDYLKTRIRSKKEINDYLLKNKASLKDITKIITKLEEEGYINDSLFTKCYINDSINLKNYGPYKIRKMLDDYGISKEIIDSNLTIYTKEKEEIKIKKHIEKEVKLNKNNSSYTLKNKILLTLINKGFTKEYIIPLLKEVKVAEGKIYEKEYQKYYNKLSKKYQGKELDYKVKEKLYQKGLKKD